MKRSLLSSLAALVASAMTALVVAAPNRVGPKSPFGPCAAIDFEVIDIGFGPPPPAPPQEPDRVDFGHPCFGPT